MIKYSTGGGVSFYQKYRAKTFSEMVGQEHVVQTLLQSIQDDTLVHAYLLTGPRGIGKTSTARLLAKAINCLEIARDRKEGKKVSGEPCNHCEACLEINNGTSIDVIEIDAASHTGVDDIRELIEKVRLSPTHLRKKVYIIDEVHMLSKSAFNALLKTLEEPPEHAVFIMATTEVHKIPVTVLSRAQRFDFKRATKKEIVENLKIIAQKEKIIIDDASLDLIAASANGGHRDAIGLLEKVNSIGKEIKIDAARTALGIADIFSIFELMKTIFDSQAEEGLKIVHQIYDQGFDPSEYNRLIVETLRKMLLVKISDETLFDDTDENIKILRDLASKISVDKIVETISNFIDSSVSMKEANEPLLPLEIAIIKSAGQPFDSAQGKPISKTDIEEVIETKPAKEIMTSEKMYPLPRVPKEKKDFAMPVPVLEMTNDVWQSVIDAVKKENSTLAALLKDAKPLALDSNTLKLGVKFKFHNDKISEPKNCAILEEVVKEIIGKDCRVVCEIVGHRPDSPTIPPKKLEKSIEEVFDLDK